MLQLMRNGCSYTYPPLSIARYSVIQLRELEQCRVNKLAQGFNTAAQDSNPGPLSRESEALPQSHCALQLQEWFWDAHENALTKEAVPASTAEVLQRAAISVIQLLTLE